MSLLPEEDEEYLKSKGIKYEFLAEKGPDGNQRQGVLFPAFAIPSSLRMQKDAGLVECANCDLLVVVPQGYATTKLDSFYTIPRLKRLDGSDPQAAANDATLFGRSWQFWSRHLSDKEWRVGIDGLDTYLNYIRRELRSA